MKVSIIVVLCLAALATAAPVDETRGVIADKIQEAINNLTNQIQTLLANKPDSITAGLIAALQAALQQLLQMRHTRGIFDGMADMFGLSEVWATLSSFPGQALNSLYELMQKILFVSKEKWTNEVKPILVQLVADLKAHTSEATTYIQKAVEALKAILGEHIGKREIMPEFQRGFWDTVASIFGLNEIWATITHLSGVVKDKFFDVLSQLMFAGTSAWAAAVPVFQQLVQDMKGHAENAIPLLTAAIAQLTEIIKAAAGKREVSYGVIESLSTLFGLDKIVDTISTMTATLKEKFTAVMEQLLFAGTNMWAQAVPIFKQLIADVLAHGKDSAKYFEEAIKKLKEIMGGLAGGKRSLVEKRGLIDTIGGFFGIADLGATLSSIHSNISDNIQTLIAKLFMMGTQVWGQIVPILTNLVSDLHLHAADAQKYLTAAYAALLQIFNDFMSKPKARGLAQDLFSGFFGFDMSNVITLLTNIHTTVTDKFSEVLTNLFFMGNQVKEQVIPILKQLVKDLKDHAMDAQKYLQVAYEALLDIYNNIKGQGKRAAINDFIMNTLGFNQFVELAQQLGEKLKGDLMKVIAQIMFAGMDVIAQAKVVIDKMIADIKEHAGNTVDIVQKAIAALTALVRPQ
jgi:hypothetical protein